MSAKILSALSDDNRNLRKQMGSLSAYKFFHSNNFSARQKAQENIVNANDSGLQKEIARVTKGPPCSYTSSLTSNSRLNKTEMIPSRASIAMKEKQQEWNKVMQSSDIRDIVRDSMYREARSLPIKPQNNGDIPATSLVKYIDSPRPLQRSALRKPELMIREGLVFAPTEVYVPTKNYSKDERLILPRFSFDKQESGEIMKPKELPRLSLDSRETAMRNSDSLFESRKSPPNQEHGTQKRLSSVVAKLMGLDTFPDPKSTPEVCSTTTKAQQNKSTSIAFITPEGKTHHQLSISHAPQKDFEASSQLHHSGISNVTMEKAPWKQQDYGNSSPRNKPLANDLDQSFVVYGEAKRRIEESELRYGKDLRALKQILESLQQMSRGLQNENVDCSKLPQRCSDQKPNFSTWQNKTLEQDATARTRSHRSSAHHADKSISLTNEKVNPQDRKHQRKNNLTQSKNDITPWKGAWRNSVADPTSRTRSTSGRVSPRVPLNPLKAQDNSPTSTLSMELRRDRKHSGKVSAEKSSMRRKKHSRANSLQSLYDQLSELSSDTRCSSNQGDTASIKSDGKIGDASQMEIVDTRFLAGSINTYSRGHPNCLKPLSDCTASLKLATMEQPSPVSVLDSSLYNEDAPSPIAKISTTFHEEETISPERGWNTENPLYFKAGFQDESRFNSENPPTHFRAKYVGNAENINRSASLDPDMIYISEEKLFSEHPEHTLINRKPDGVLWSRLPNDSNELNPRFNRIADAKNSIDTEIEMLIRDEMFTSRTKSTNLETLMKEISTETRNEKIRSLNAEQMHESEDWEDFGVEIPRLVLEIERQIFKDMINEVILTGPLPFGKPKKARRKLF